LGAIRTESGGCKKEGFPKMRPDEFISMFIGHMPYHFGFATVEDAIANNTAAKRRLKTVEDSILVRIEFTHS
jgi:hypothetical protein